MSASKLSNSQPWLEHFASLRAKLLQTVYSSVKMVTHPWMISCNNPKHISLTTYPSMTNPNPQTQKMFATTILAEVPTIYKMKSWARRVWGRWGGRFCNRVTCILGHTPVNRYPCFHIYSTFSFKPCPIWPISTLGCSLSRRHWLIDLVSSIRNDSWMSWLIHLVSIRELSRNWIPESQQSKLCLSVT